jgi:aspartate/methionine/tyrosine aminotransferase
MTAFRLSSRFDSFGPVGEENPFACAVRTAREEGRALLDLTVSNPTEVGLPYPEEIVLDSLKDPRILRYLPEPRGLPAARDAVAEYYRTVRGIEVSPENLFLTSGTSEAYTYLFKVLCDPGDTILVPRPGYPLFDWLAACEHVYLEPYLLRESDGASYSWRLDLEYIETLAGRSDVRALVLVQPHNPTGHYLSEEESQHLIECAQRYNLPLIVDEVFSDYVRPTPGTLTQQHTVCGVPIVHRLTTPTFTLNGISKMLGLPQMKLAWIYVSCPDRYRRDLMHRLECVADTYLSVGTPIQWALPKLLANRSLFQEPLKERLEQNEDFLIDAVSNLASVTYRPARAGWYAVLTFPDIAMDDETLALALLRETEVLCHPGYFYDFDTPTRLVLSLLPPPGRFQEAVTRLTHAIPKM